MSTSLGPCLLSVIRGPLCASALSPFPHEDTVRTKGLVSFLLNFALRSKAAALHHAESTPSSPLTSKPVREPRPQRPTGGGGRPGTHLQVVLQPRAQNLPERVVGVLLHPAVDVHALGAELHGFCWEIPFLASRKTEIVRGNKGLRRGYVNAVSSRLVIPVKGEVQPTKGPAVRPRGSPPPPAGCPGTPSAASSCPPWPGACCRPWPERGASESGSPCRRRGSPAGGGGGSRAQCVTGVPGLCWSPGHSAPREARRPAQSSTGQHTTRPGARGTRSRRAHASNRLWEMPHRTLAASRAACAPPAHSSPLTRCFHRARFRNQNSKRDTPFYFKSQFTFVTRT